MAITKYQCSKCGKQTTTAGSAPGQQSCPNGGYHVWSKLGRLIKQITDWI
jgi:DNA-directed RNA polymerase subunit RPC12/RpoP